jgi:hypothetical protein
MNLHATYSKKSALTQFDGEPQELCDGQFTVLPTAVLGFLTMVKSTDGSHLRNPSSVIWKPNRLDYASSEEHPWFPRNAREVFDRSGREVVRMRRHHIFIRFAGAIDYVYAGEAHLGSFGGPRGDYPGNREACFTLAQKLPRDVWLQCGGYSGWQIDVNHKEHVISQTDHADFDHLLEELAKPAYSHWCMTRYKRTHCQFTPTQAGHG